MKKYVFTLIIVEDAGYDGGITEFKVISSFNNNKLSVIRDNLLNELTNFKISNLNVCKKYLKENWIKPWDDSCNSTHWFKIQRTELI